MCIPRERGHPAAEIDPLHHTYPLLCTLVRAVGSSSSSSGVLQAGGGSSGVLAAAVLLHADSHSASRSTALIHAIANPHDMHADAVSIRASQVVIRSQVRLLAVQLQTPAGRRCFSLCSADPRQAVALFYSLLAVLVFTASCFRISFSPKVQLISPSHTSPLLRCPPDRPNIFTHLPETIRSISVPVVFGGSCSSSMAVERAAALCCVKTSVPTRLCIALIFFFFV